MRVLHVNDYRQAGGCEVVMHRTVELLRERGIVAEIFTAEDIPGFRRTAWGYITSQKTRQALARRLSKYQPEVIHLHNFYHLLSPSVLAAIAEYRLHKHVRVVMTAHDYHLICPNAGLYFIENGTYIHAKHKQINSIPRLAMRRWDRRSRVHSFLKFAQHVWNYRLRDLRRVIDCILCPSRFLQNTIAEFNLPTEYIPLPAPHIELPANRSRNELQLLFAGRIEPEKGLAEFLKCIPDDFEGGLLIYGDGSDVSICQEICDRRGLIGRVEFAGMQPREKVLEAMCRSHVMVLPSLWVENYPMSLLEALACGTNLLVSNFGGMKEIIDVAGVGCSFTPKDPNSLRRALLAIRSKFREGTLNSFDVSHFLIARNDCTYANRVFAAYDKFSHDGE